MSSADSPNFPSLHLRHSSFSNPSVALPTSQLILQPFRCFTYVTAHSPILLCSFSKFAVTSPTSQLILQPFRRFTYVTPHSPTLPLLHLHHSSISNQPFFRFSYVTGSPLMAPGEPPMVRRSKGSRDVDGRIILKWIWGRWVLMLETWYILTEIGCDGEAM